MIVVDDPTGRLPRIEKIWAFVSVDDDGDEGLVAANVNGSWMPLLAADEKRVDSLREMAALIGKETGKRIVLARFETRVDQEVIGGEP